MLVLLSKIEKNVVISMSFFCEMSHANANANVKVLKLLAIHPKNKSDVRMK